MARDKQISSNQYRPSSLPGGVRSSSSPPNTSDIIRAIQLDPSFKLQESQLPFPESVQPAILEGTWANNGAPYEDAGYFRDGLNIVHLVGAPYGGDNTGSGPWPIFTLPERYRPSGLLLFSGADIGLAVVIIGVTTAGVVEVFAAAAGATFGTIPLGHISFRAQ